MSISNKDLLNLENKNSLSVTTESNLIMCKNNQCRQFQNPNSKLHDGMPFTSAVPQSQVLGKVKDFLGVFSEANKRMQDDTCISDYDIEALSGTTSEYIEMDLMLGVADLHTPEAIAAAESAIAGYQPVISFAANASSNDESTDDESDDDGDSGNYNDIIPNDEAKSLDGNFSIEPSKKGKSKKRPKIVELL